METSSDRSVLGSEDRASGPGLSRRGSRRALLALGAWFAGGRAVLAGAAEPGGSAQARATGQARLKLAQTGLEVVRGNVGRGLFAPGERDPIAVWSRRRLEARLELEPSKPGRIAAAQEHVDEMKNVEEIVGRMHKAGLVDQLARMDAEYRRLEAEAWLEKERAT